MSKETLNMVRRKHNVTVVTILRHKRDYLILESFGYVVHSDVTIKHFVNILMK